MTERGRRREEEEGAPLLASRLRHSPSLSAGGGIPERAQPIITRRGGRGGGGVRDRGERAWAEGALRDRQAKQGGNNNRIIPSPASLPSISGSD